MRKIRMKNQKRNMRRETMLKTIRAKPKDVEEVLQRYPRLTGHLISESLGYFTPRSAANAILRHIQKLPFCCEWYSHCAQSYDDTKLLKVGRDQLNNAFRRRMFHVGYMAWYDQARKLVDQARSGGKDPVFASWF
jgi:hypothetical protein